MSTKQKTIEAVMSPPATHMAGDRFRAHSFFLVIALLIKKIGKN